MLLTKLAKKYANPKNILTEFLYTKKEWEKALLFFEKSIIKKQNMRRAILKQEYAILNCIDMKRHLNI